ncbi:MAG: YibE/F family protein [Bacteroidales bacterium]|nr:YibE/F family protein [Bacteroidales bacterium]
MNKNIIFSIVIITSIAILCIIPTGFENHKLTNNNLREKAIVLNVDNNDLENYSVVTVGTQHLNLKILTGKFKGKVVSAQNILLGQMKIDKVFEPNDKVLAVLKTNETNSKILSARADDYYRINLMWILFVLFAFFLIGFAKWTGFKALISFVFTAVCIWKILIPLILKGFSPILVSLSTVALITTVIILLISGFSKKGIVALSGAIAGVSITSLLAIVFGVFFKIPGTVQEFSDTILYAGFTNLRLSDIFISCIFISAAGAVMDVAMDIAASQDELINKKPDLTTKELTLSGFKIAYPVIGTMTTTLLFAYSGSFLFVFMTFMTKGTPLISVFNTNYIAAEILHTLVGSFGLVLVAPITSIVGGYIYPTYNKQTRNMHL